MASGHGHLVTYGTKSGTLPSLSGLHLRALQREDTYYTVVQNHQTIAHYGVRFSISNVSLTFSLYFQYLMYRSHFVLYFRYQIYRLHFVLYFQYVMYRLHFVLYFVLYFQ